MICQKCGKEIDDNAKFCAYCGAPANAESAFAAQDTFEEEPTLREESVEQQVSFDDEATVIMNDEIPSDGAEDIVLSDVKKYMEESDSEQTPVEPVQEITPDPIPVVPLQENSNFSGVEQQTSNMDSASAEEEIPVSNPKKSHTGVVVAILAAIAVVVVCAVIFLVKVLFGGDKLDSRVFYIKDSELNAITNIKDSDPDNVQIEDIRNGDAVHSGGLARLSSDGSYLYYFSDVDSDGELGTLCRIPTEKIKLKESANEKLVEEIDDKVNIYYGFTILDDNTVVYTRKSNQLTWYDGKESYDLGDCEYTNYWVTDDDKYVVYIEDDTLVAVEISKKASTTEIDDDVKFIMSVGDKDFILYGQEHGQDEYSVCVAGVDKEPEVIADDVDSYYDVDSTNRSFYYTIRNEREVSLYDYVDDPYADEDADIAEPQVKDYLKEVSATQAISEGDQEYYSNMDEFMEGELYNYDDEVEAWRYFNIDDMTTYYYNSDLDKWYELPDDDAYSQAWDAYYAVDDRKSLREALKEERISDDYSQLFYYSDGKSTEVCASVDNIQASSRQALVYTKTSVDETPTTQYKIDDITSTYDLREKIEDSDDTDATYYFCNEGVGESEVTGLDSVDSLLVSKDGKTALIAGDYDYDDETFTILSYAVSSSGLGKEAEISSDAYDVTVYGNEFYYFEDVEDSMGTLYVYDGNKSYLLAENIADFEIFYADDGNLIGYNDVDYGIGDLAIYDKNGKDERVARDVSSYTYLGQNCFLLMKDEDLYYIDKKGNETRLARNVSYYLYPGSEDGHWIN